MQPADIAAPHSTDAGEVRYRVREAELQALLDSVGDGVYIGNRAGITVANDAAFRQLGFASCEELSRHLATLSTELRMRDARTGESIAAGSEPFTRALDGEPVVQELLIRHRTTGEERILRRAASPVVVDGRVMAAVVVDSDITERRRVESELAADLRDTQMLRELGARLVAESGLEVIGGEILAAAIAITRADAGSVQLLDEATQELVALASSGFDQAMTRGFMRVSAASPTSCGIALAERERVVIHFAEVDDEEGSARRHLAAGFLSAQSTPLVGRMGAPLGMLSTHWRERRVPTERELRFLDLLARQAADTIERRLVQEALRDLNETLERRVAERTADRQHAEAERDALRRELLVAEEAERRRLSRELHDEVGQHLTALGLGLKALSDVAPAHSEVGRRADELQQLAATMGRELHSLAVRLRPKVLDDFGLEAALATYADEWSTSSGIALDVHARVDRGRLPEAVESAIYRIVQEGLTNVAKHSRATSASVLVERRDGQVVTVIEDDGIGFEPDIGPGTRAGAGAGGLGLLGVRERVTLLRGSVEIETVRGRGTALFVRIPIAPSAAFPATTPGVTPP